MSEREPGKESRRPHDKRRLTAAAASSNIRQFL